MNYEEAKDRKGELTDAAKVERFNGGSKHLVALIEAQIEIHKESAIRQPAKAEEFRGSVIALRQLLSATEHTTDE